MDFILFFILNFNLKETFIKWIDKIKLMIWIKI